MPFIATLPLLKDFKKRTSERRNGFALPRREGRGLAHVAINGEMATAIDNGAADLLSQFERVAQTK